MEYMVEGHTDNVPFKSGELVDNWDLSVKRATAVVRLLQNQYGLEPSQLIAAGRGEYKPLTGNTSAEGKAANRRTRIVICLNWISSSNCSKENNNLLGLIYNRITPTNQFFIPEYGKPAKG